MSTYYAITNRNGQWLYVYSGQDPEAVYREAAEIVERQYIIPGDEGAPISSSTELQLDTLRVVPEEIAREKYHVVFSRAMIEE